MTLQATTEAAPAPEHEAVAKVIRHADEQSAVLALGQAGPTPLQNRLAERAPREIDEALIADELLVEEVSIDGMCGVY